VPVRERWGCLPFPSMPSEVVCLPNDLAMNEMTRVANTPGVYEDLSLKIKFRKSLGEALGTIRESQLLDSGSQRVAVKRAGVVAAELLHGPDKALVYEAKRLPFDGTLGVGMDDPDRVLTADNLDGQDVEIDEVFVASGITVLGFMADIHSRGIRPESLTIVAPFTAQRGAEAILDLSSRIGLKTRILTNRIYYWLNDHWYVLVTPEEEIWQEIAGDDPNVEVQAGGDAGDLTEN